MSCSGNTKSPGFSLVKSKRWLYFLPVKFIDQYMGLEVFRVISECNVLFEIYR